MSENGLIYEPLEEDVSHLLQKNFTNKFRKGYVKCKEFALPEYFREFGDRIKNMEIRNDDLWVCSFPKGGTTWTQEMVWCIANDLNFEGAKEFLPQRFPFLEHSPLFDYRELMAKDPSVTFPPYVLDSVDYINNKPSPRFVKSHLPFTLLPEQLQRGTTSAKIIYVARNPRDTCVSYFHHCTLLEGFQGDFDLFCELFLKGAVCFGPFWNHVLSFWEHRDDKNVLFITFEDMKKDLRSVIKRTAEFLGKDLSDEGICQLMEHLKFDNMKQNRAVNYEPVVEINKKYRLIEKDGTFMRSGKVGEWRDIMHPAYIEKFRTWEECSLRGYNLVL